MTPGVSSVLEEMARIFMYDGGGTALAKDAPAIQQAAEQACYRDRLAALLRCESAGSERDIAACVMQEIRAVQQLIAGSV